MWWGLRLCGSAEHPVGRQHACVWDELNGLNCETLSILWAISTCVCVCVCAWDKLDGLLTVQSAHVYVRVCVCVCVWERWAGWTLDCATLNILWAISTCVCVREISWMDSWLCNSAKHPARVCMCVCVLSWMDSTVHLCWASYGLSACVHVCVWWTGWTLDCATLLCISWAISTCVCVCVCVCACVCVCVMSWMDSWPPRLNVLQMADRQSNRPAIWDFDMCTFGDVGNVIIFQCKLWRFVSGSQRKHHLSSPITVFLKSTLFSSSFLWKTRTNAKPLISPFVIQSHGTDFKVLPYVQFVLQDTRLAPNVTSFPSPCHNVGVTALTFIMIM